MRDTSNECILTRSHSHSVNAQPTPRSQGHRAHKGPAAPCRGSSLHKPHTGAGTLHTPSCVLGERAVRSQALHGRGDGEQGASEHVDPGTLSPRPAPGLRPRPAASPGAREMAPSLRTQRPPADWQQEQRLRGPGHRLPQAEPLVYTSANKAEGRVTPGPAQPRGLETPRCAGSTAAPQEPRDRHGCVRMTGVSPTQRTSGTRKSVSVPWKRGHGQALASG